MSSICAVQSFPGANACVQRHWPFFERAGFDEIISIGTTDEGCWRPPGVKQELIGANLYCVGSHLPSRLLRTFMRLLQTKHEWLCVSEYDVLFLREIPTLPKGLTTHLAGGKPAGCHCNAFFHPPWICDRETAWKIIKNGATIIESGLVDASPDCFLGQVVEAGNIPVHTDILKSYSRNTINQPNWIREAREAIANGAVCIHGVKSSEVLDAITKESACVSSDRSLI